MNQTIEELFRRKSTREYLEKEIPAQEKRLILESAAQAPTAGNQMLYTVLDITDPSLKKTLSETCDHQPFIAKAPLVLLFLADCRRWLDAYRAAGCAPRKPGCGDFLLAFADAFIAAQNAVTAAESLGIGSCYIGDILENCETHRELLKLPDYVVPAALLIFGYPTKRQEERRKPVRFDLRHIVQENTYSPLPEKELREMFREQAGDRSEWEFERYVSAFCRRKYESGFAREMNRSAECYFRQFIKEIN